MNTRGSYRCHCAQKTYGLYCQNYIVEKNMGFFGNTQMVKDCKKSCGIDYQVFHQSCLCKDGNFQLLK